MSANTPQVDAEEIERLTDQVDVFLDFLVSGEVEPGEPSTISESFGAAIEWLGKRIYRLGGHDALLTAAQLIVLRRPELGPKRLQLLKEAVPAATRFAALQHPK